MISVIRCLVLHEIVWFANLNENIVAIVVNLTALVLSILTRIFIQIKLHAEGKILGYTLFLTNELTMCNTATVSFQALMFLPITLVAFSMFIELYIGIKIKKLSCFRFIPVTIGHLFMIAFLIFMFDLTKQNPNLQSIQNPLIIISLQLLFVVRQKDYVIKFLKKCCNVLNNTVVPVNQDLEINDFGIFVGPQVISHPTLDSDERPSRDTPEFGGVYMG
jgi:hypothetical protein